MCANSVEYSHKDLIVKYLIEHRHEQVMAMAEKTTSEDLFGQMIAFRAAAYAQNMTGMEKYYQRLRVIYDNAFTDKVTFKITFRSKEDKSWYDFIDKVNENIFPADYLCVEILAKRALTDDYTIVLENGNNTETLEICENNLRIKSNGDGKRLFTDSWHIYHSTLSKTGSMIFVDGSLVLSSDLLHPAKALRVDFLCTHGYNPELFRKSVASISIYASPEPTVYFNSGYDLFKFQKDYAQALYKLMMYERSAEELANLGCASVPGIKEKVWDLAKNMFFSKENPVNLTVLRRDKLLRFAPSSFETVVKIKAKSNQQPVVEVKDLGIRFAKNPAYLSSPLYLMRRLIMRKEQFQEHYYHWIFRHLSFRLYPEEVFGIIGPNGAGKSTLLRILGGLVNFSEGEVTVRSNPILLQPGIGIRPLFSGYENVFFALSYYGLSRKETKRVIDEIIEFSGLSEAIYRPCIYYSTGMIARLTFSIATAIVPDLLMLDELLGPGDVKFREKATARMFELIDRAKLVIIVSHNLGFIRNYCTKVLYLNENKAKFLGNPHDAVDMYLQDTNPRHKVESYASPELESMFREEL